MVGYSVDERQWAGGESIELNTHWRVVRQPTTDHGITLRLVDEDGRLWGQDDRRPRNADFVLSSGWQAGQSIVVRHLIPVAVGTPPGHLKVEASVYRLDNLRLLSLDQPRSGTSAVFGPIEVGPTSPGASDPRLSSAGNSFSLPGVSLVGSAIGSAEVVPGGGVPVAVLWRAGSDRVSGVDARLQLVDQTGVVIAEKVFVPGAGRHPPERWQSGELVRDQEVLLVPARATGGPTRIRLLLRVLAPDGAVSDANANLGQVEIRGIERIFTKPDLSDSLNSDLRDLSNNPQVTLLGARVNPGTARPGETITVALFWHATAEPSRDYRVFNHLLSPDGRLVAQADGVPRQWSRPTSGWLLNEIVEDPHDIRLPRDLAPGTYRLIAGMYDPATGHRLIGDDGRDFIHVVDVDIG
jgi:hypothetical protein